MHFLSNADELWVLAALVPLGLAAAAWALQMACGFCSTDPPEFPHAITTVVIVAVANAILRLILQTAGLGEGIGPEYVAPALTTTTIIAISLPTGPFTALTITAVQLVLCTVMYFGLAWLHTIVEQSVMML
jgi:hypothetical protein